MSSHAAPWSRGHPGTGTRLFLLPAVLLLIAGCSAKSFGDLRPGIETRGHYIETVPFYRQTESTCGPAALAAVLAFWRHPVDIARITSSVFLPELRGALPMDVENYAREEGFQTRSSAGSIDRLKETIRKNVPVICLLDLGFGVYHRPHYVTAVGFDDVNRVMLVHDGAEPNRVMDYDAFRKAWDRAGRWMLVITPGPGGAGHGP